MFLKILNPFSLQPRWIKQLFLDRPFLAEIEKSKRAEAEAKESEMEANLRKADLQSIQAKLDNDFTMLREREASKQSESVKHAKDLKYLAERQLRLGWHVFVNCGFAGSRFGCGWDLCKSVFLLLLFPGQKRFLWIWEKKFNNSYNKYKIWCL